MSLRSIKGTPVAHFSGDKSKLCHISEKRIEYINSIYDPFKRSDALIKLFSEILDIPIHDYKLQETFCGVKVDNYICKVGDVFEIDQWIDINEYFLIANVKQEKTGEIWYEAYVLFVKL